MAPHATVRGEGEAAQGGLVAGGGPDELDDHEAIVGAASGGDDEARDAGASRRVRELADSVGSSVVEAILSSSGEPEMRRRLRVSGEDEASRTRAPLPPSMRGDTKSSVRPMARQPRARQPTPEGRAGSMQALRHSTPHHGPGGREGGDAIADG